MNTSLIRLFICLKITALLIVFISLEAKAQFTSSNLPIILIDTDQGVAITKERIVANMKIVFNTDQRNLVTGPYNNYDGLIAIKGRGSSSWERYEKKGYTLETQLATGENNNVSLLGLPAENDWVLHGPYADKTLMKNAFVYTLGSKLGRYAPRHNFCELVLNGEYRGVYLLVERIKRDKNRVDIATLSPDEVSGDDLTGGYIMRLDRDEGDGYSWKGDFGFDLSYFNYYYPDPDAMAPVQRDYIRSYIDEFEYALAVLPLSDTQRGYRSFINMASFIDYFIISELTKNIDAYRLSTYFYKDKHSKGGKLTMGPIWDFNLSCGGINIGFGDWGAQPENWVSDELPGGVPFWWNRLLEDRYYNSCLQERWSTLRETVLNVDQFNSLIDGYATLLDEAKDRNFAIFPLAEEVWGNNHSGLSYPEELMMLKNFMTARLAWMDQAISSLPAGMECLECFVDCPPPVISALNETGGSISVYPNPATGQAKLSLDRDYPTPLKIEFYDPSGRKILTQKLNKGGNQRQWLLNLTELNGGLYSYKLYSNSFVIRSGRLLIE